MLNIAICDDEETQVNIHKKFVKIQRLCHRKIQRKCHQYSLC